MSEVLLHKRAAEIVGIHIKRYHLTLLTLLAIRLPARRAAIVHGIRAMCDEEICYWLAQCHHEPDRAARGRAKKALRILLAG